MVQIFFSQRCPLFNRKLGIGMRVLYASSCWCYVTNTLAIPLSVLVSSRRYIPAGSQPAAALCASDRELLPLLMNPANAA